MDVARGLGRILPSIAIATALVVAPARGLLARPPPDCQMAPPIEEAVRTSELVFVGTVTAIDNEGRSATVQVEEVWRGDASFASATPSATTLRRGCISCGSGRRSSQIRPEPTAARLAFAEVEGRICVGAPPCDLDVALLEQRLRIAGSDIDPEVLSLAGYHARQAGVGRNCRFSR